VSWREGWGAKKYKKKGEIKLTILTISQQPGKKKKEKRRGGPISAKERTLRFNKSTGEVATKCGKKVKNNFVVSA